MTIKRTRVRRDDTSPKNRRGGANSSYDRPVGTSRTFPKSEDGERRERPAFGGERKSFGDRPSFGGGERRERPAFGGERKSFGDRPSFGGGERRERPAFGGERKSFGDRPSFGGGERRERPAFGGERKSFGDRPSFGGDREKRSFGGERSERPAFGGERKSFGDRPSFGGDREKRSFGGERSERPAFGGERKSFGDRPSFGGDREKRSFGGERSERPAFGGERKSFGDRPSFGGDREKRSFGGERSERPAFGGERKSFGDRPAFGGDREKRSFGGERSERPAFGGGERKSFGDRPAFGGDREKRSFGGERSERPAFGGGERKSFGDRPAFGGGERRERPAFGGDKKKTLNDNSINLDEIRLNRYIANAGVCSRRKADELISLGEVTVNGEQVAELGYKVKSTDTVHCNGQLLRLEKMVYILLNKPKDYITTTDDPRERKTVMELVRNMTNERVYPVGRLDRNTTGLLLLTNDGDLAEKLSHPRNDVPKIYQATLTRNFKTTDFEILREGVTLEDGFVKPDDLAYSNAEDKKEVGIQIHSGKNRVIRRMFEHLGYEVEKLDRVMYANLTKKDLGRGRCRHLNREKLLFLKRLVKK